MKSNPDVQIDKGILCFKNRPGSTIRTTETFAFFVSFAVKVLFRSSPRSLRLSGEMFL